MKKKNKDLIKLANAYNIQTSYLDVNNKQVLASDQTLLALLQGFNIDLNNQNDISQNLFNVYLEYWEAGIESSINAWGNTSINLILRLQKNEINCKIKINIKNKNDYNVNLTVDLSKLPVYEAVKFNKHQYFKKIINIKNDLAYGYYQITVQCAKRNFNTLLINAPKYIYTPITKQNKKLGIFVPMYALHSKESFGCGDIKDFEKLIEWSKNQKINIIATLPIYASFLNELYESSPYSPVSRLFYNEIYLNMDPNNIFNLSSLKKDSYINYKEIMHQKRNYFEKKQLQFYQSEQNLNELKYFFEKFPKVHNYAMFRALNEKFKCSWQKWICNPPKDLALNKQIKKSFDYHVYVQYKLRQNLEQLNHYANSAKINICFDLPLGVHPDGFDTYAYAKDFLLQTNAGAPPDMVFPKGQNWGFPALNPLHLKKSGYQYFIDCLAAVMPYVDMLRMDHIMHLHRLYCIPKDFESSEGCYQRYPFEDFYAILAIESHKHKVALIGENLGTVPQYINNAMKKNHLYSMYVYQYELESKTSYLTKKVSKQSVASVNTHDMPTFAAFCAGTDIDRYVSLGFIPIQLKKEKQLQRKKLIQKLIHFFKLKPKNNKEIKIKLFLAIVNFLIRSDASMIILNLEDIWLEKKSQNIPSTPSFLNWKRKLRYSLDELDKKKQILEIFQVLNKKITKL